MAHQLACSMTLHIYASDRQGPSFHRDIFINLEM